MIDGDKLKLVREIKKISLKENDILVARVRENITMEGMEILIETINSILKELNLKNKTILIPDYYIIEKMNPMQLDEMIDVLKKLRKEIKGKDDRNITT